MKVYAGDRTIDGIVVTVNGEPLHDCMEIKAFTRNGFEWTYEGNESRQLALALLYDYLGEANEALALTEPFMTAIIANLDNSWELTADDVESAVQTLRGS